MNVCCAMSSPCAPVVSLNVNIVRQPAGGASVGSEDFGIGATVGCEIGVGAATVGTLVAVAAGAAVGAANSDVRCPVAAPHAASSVPASSVPASSADRTVTSQTGWRAKRGERGSGDMSRNKSLSFLIQSERCALATLVSTCAKRL